MKLKSTKDRNFRIMAESKEKADALVLQHFTHRDLSTEEAALVMANYASGTGKNGFTLDEVERVMAYAGELRMGTVVLECILDGRIALDLVDGEIHLSAGDAKEFAEMKKIAIDSVGQFLQVTEEKP